MLDKSKNATDRVKRVNFCYVENSSFEYLYSAVENIKFNQTGRKSKAGTVYTQTVSLFYPTNLETDLPSAIDPYKHKLKLEYLSGKTLTLGDSIEFFLANCNFISEVLKSGYKVTFTRKCLNPAKI